MLDFELSQTDANSIETCIPWEISYKFLHYRNDVVTECRSRNENNPCAINSCIVELNFVKNIMEKYKSKIMPDAEFKHKNGFDRDLICHGKIAKVEYFNLAESPKLSETDQELINSPEFLKLVKEESKSPADTQQMMANLRSLQSGFEDLDPNFIQPGDGFLENLPNQPNFSSMTELVETLPPNLQTKFFSHTKPGSNEILNKSCCGNYPHRKPYHTGNLATGEIRMCCGDKTFNPLKLKCCRGILDPFNFYVRKRCPDETDVAYVL